GELVHRLQHVCLWDDLPDLSRQALDAVQQEAAHRSIAEGPPADPLPPFYLLSLATPTTAEQQRCGAQRWVEQRLKATLPRGPFAFPAGRRGVSAKIRLGYLSADF